MLSGIEPQEVSNSEGSPVVTTAVARKQEMQEMQIDGESVTSQMGAVTQMHTVTDAQAVTETGVVRDIEAVTENMEVTTVTTQQQLNTLQHSVAAPPPSSRM